MILSSRRYPPESKQQDRRQGGDGRPEMLLMARQIRPPRRRPDAGGAAAIGLRRPGKAMWAAWPTVPSIAAICAWVVSIMISQSQHSHETPGTRPGQRVERRQRRLAVRDRVTAELDLHEDLDHARQQDQPEQAETGLGTQAGRVDQLSGPHDRGGQDQPRPDLADRLRKRVRRLLDRLGRQCVQIVGSRRSCHPGRRAVKSRRTVASTSKPGGLPIRGAPRRRTSWTHLKPVSSTGIRCCRATPLPRGKLPLHRRPPRTPGCTSGVPQLVDSGRHPRPISAVLVSGLALSESHAPAR